MQTTGSGRQRTRVPARNALFVAVAGVLAAGAARAPRAELARPERDELVLAQVPARSDPAVRALAQLESSAARAPRDQDAAVVLARRYIELSRRDGDPRYLGSAEAALSAFTSRPDASPDVLLLYATILQSRHEFERALQELDRVLVVRPDDAQAWLTRATVQTVRGHYDEARTHCELLADLLPPFYRTACLAPIEAITGHGERALASLGQALVATREPSERAWLESLRGEYAYWLADPRAEPSLKQALRLDAGDRYTRAVLADLLLDQGRRDELHLLLRGHESDDALALRMAIADLADGRADSPAVLQVARSFEASRLRGDAVHRREEARFWLARGQARRALGCALESWAVQHEPWDARIVLESALAAKRPADAASVLQWLAETHFAAPRLLELAHQLETHS